MARDGVMPQDRASPMNSEIMKEVVRIGLKGLAVTDIYFFAGRVVIGFGNKTLAFEARPDGLAVEYQLDTVVLKNQTE